MTRRTPSPPADGVLRLPDGDLLLAGLALHTQLDRLLLDGASLPARVHLRSEVAEAQPALLDLFADLDAVVGDTGLAHRP
ncbi:hypothetical protein [Micromonospora sp. SH-82]|uniref:hypothetical protein n=1 Tax=Micromonospora sp. SH-82 TaxID=3132938 RepID=UPI003EBF9134